MTHPARHPRALLALLFAGLGLVGALATESSGKPPAAAPVPAVAEPAKSLVENSVVKIFATMRYPDPYRPWTKQAPVEITGSGVVIEGKRILTNSHVVLYASQVLVQANQAGDKIGATVIDSQPGIDLAVLKLDDETFFDSHPAVVRAGSLPEIKDAVLAYGFPTGGNSLSITKGIVSRIEFAPYNYPVSGLRIQIDAAINPGNSGGPAFVNDKMIGLAFSRLGGADNIGYIIPNEEIDLYLADIADGHYDGKPAMFDDRQTLENPALRAFLRLDKSTEGLVIHRPDRTDADYPLKQWDVITKIGDTKVDDQGMIKIGGDIRVHYTYLLQKIVHDGKVPLTIVRAGKTLSVEVPVLTDHPQLIPDVRGEYPSYFVYGPLVFTKATLAYLNFMGNNAPLMGAFSYARSPLVTRRGDAPAFEGEELVVVASPFFPHKLAKGYGNPSAQVIDTINGIKIKNLKHLVEVLRDLKDDFVIIEFNLRSSESPIFSRKEMLAATEEILNDNGVRAQGSPDLMAVWNATPAK